MSLTLRLVALAVLPLAAGCGLQTREPVAAAPPSAEPSPAESATPIPSPPADGVVFDEPWVVEEGVWHLAGPGEFPVPGGALLERTGLLDLVTPTSVVVFGPAMYGKYAVRIRLHPARPSVPAWCEDVVEIPFTVGAGGVSMGSFESGTDTLAVPPGEYRMRYCVAGHDAAARETAEDEFDGDDYRLYSSRHLFQLWRSPQAPAEVVRLGSDFARSALD